MASLEPQLQQKKLGVLAATGARPIFQIYANRREAGPLAAGRWVGRELPRIDFCFLLKRLPASQLMTE